MKSLNPRFACGDADDDNDEEEEGGGDSGDDDDSQAPRIEARF